MLLPLSCFLHPYFYHLTIICTILLNCSNAQTLSWASKTQESFSLACGQVPLLKALGYLDSWNKGVLRQNWGFHKLLFIKMDHQFFHKHDLLRAMTMIFILRRQTWSLEISHEIKVSFITLHMTWSNYILSEELSNMPKIPAVNS